MIQAHQREFAEGQSEKFNQSLKLFKSVDLLKLKQINFLAENFDSYIKGQGILVEMGVNTI